MLASNAPLVLSKGTLSYSKEVHGARQVPTSEQQRKVLAHLTKQRYVQPLTAAWALWSFEGSLQFPARRCVIFAACCTAGVMDGYRYGYGGWGYGMLPGKWTVGCYTRLIFFWQHCSINQFKVRTMTSCKGECHSINGILHLSIPTAICDPADVSKHVPLFESNLNQNWGS